MKMIKNLILAAAVSSAFSAMAADPVFYQNWENPDLKSAWAAGYKGQGSKITVVDDFSNRSLIVGRLTNTIEIKGHGFWTANEAALVAPSANIATINYLSGNTINLQPTGLNVVNVSYGLFAPASIDSKNIITNATEKSIIDAANNGTAVVVKAAGNSAIAANSILANGTKDFMISALANGKSTIFVGALDRNSTARTQAKMTTYSNVAGNDVNVQNRFLTVGVVSTTTNLSGTSFAAPIISGYAAILGSKFTSASATQIANQLLNTARKDTLVNYRPEVYGRGEASLSRALAPIAIK